MDTKELEKRYTLLKKNQEALKFDMQISLDEQNYIHVKTNVDKRYKKALNKAINDLILEALKIGLNLFDTRDIPEESKEEYIEQWTGLFDRKKADFISVLIEDGIDIYAATVMHAAYKLNLTFSEPVHEKAS